MRTLGIYEHIVAGGCGPKPEPPSLLVEGAAMLRWALQQAAQVDPRIHVCAACHRDFRSLIHPPASVELLTAAADPERLLEDLAARCETLLVIAPETDGTLSGLVSKLEQRRKLLNLSSRWTGLFSDKVKTSRALAEWGLPCVWHEPLAGGIAERPVVVKPIDGAGCEAAQIVTGRLPVSERLCVSRLVPGLSASIGVVFGPEHHTVLPAAYQWIYIDGVIRYGGGAFPLPDRFARRASSVAHAIAERLRGERGFVGIDLVFPWRSEDEEPAVRIVEINPRLTTSFVAASVATGYNLLAVALGCCPAPRELPCRKALCFWPHGELRSIPTKRASVTSTGR